MTPDIAEEMIDRLGETMTLRRVSGPSIFVSVQVKGVTSQRPVLRDETPGAVKQFLGQVIISNREIAAAQWPGPPRRGDQIISGGRTSTIQSCDTRKIGEDIAMFWLQMDGRDV